MRDLARKESGILLYRRLPSSLKFDGTAGRKLVITTVNNTILSQSNRLISSPRVLAGF